MRRDTLARASRASPVLALAAAIACGGGQPEPGAVRLAALTAGAAADVLSDLAAVDDPDAPGVRDAFHAANVTALDSARLAHDSAPRATRTAYALSLEAAESADTFAEALGAAIEARDDLDARSRDARTARKAGNLLAEIVQRRADAPGLVAEANRLERQTRRSREAYEKWYADNPFPWGSDETEDWTAESQRRRKPWSDTLEAWERATDAIADNADALLLANLQFVELTLAKEAGESALNALSDLAADSVDAETVVLAKARPSHWPRSTPSSWPIPPRRSAPPRTGIRPRSPPIGPPRGLGADCSNRGPASDCGRRRSPRYLARCQARRSWAATGEPPPANAKLKAAPLTRALRRLSYSAAAAGPATRRSNRLSLKAGEHQDLDPRPAAHRPALRRERRRSGCRY